VPTDHLVQLLGSLVLKEATGPVAGWRHDVQQAADHQGHGCTLDPDVHGWPTLEVTPCP